MHAAHYAIFLDMRDRLAVLVGGGAVAVRKVGGLLEAGANRIRVVAPQIDAEMPSGVERVLESYRPEHLAGAGLVFAATNDPAVNAAVSRDAHARGVLVNRADTGPSAQEDAAERADFATPAVLRHGPIRVAVSAGTPALSARIRDRIGEWIDPQWIALAEATAALRPMILQAPLTSERRHAIFRDLLSPEVLAIAGEEATPGVRQWLAQRHPELGLHLPPRPKKEEL